MTPAEEYVSKHKGKKVIRRINGEDREGIVGHASQFAPDIIYVKTALNTYIMAYESELVLYDEAPQAKTNVCECGAAKVGCNTHSSWCPLHR